MNKEFEIDKKDEIYDKYLSRDTSEVFGSRFGRFRVTYNPELVQADDEDLLGLSAINLLDVTTIYVNPYYEYEDFRLTVFFHEFAHFVAMSLGCNFYADEEEELSAQLTAMSLCEAFMVDGIDDCLACIMAIRSNNNISDERMTEISQMSDFIFSTILEYFGKVIDFAYVNELPYPKIDTQRNKFLGLQ